MDGPAYSHITRSLHASVGLHSLTLSLSSFWSDHLSITWDLNCSDSSWNEGNKHMWTWRDVNVTGCECEGMWMWTWQSVNVTGCECEGCECERDRVWMWRNSGLNPSMTLVCSTHLKCHLTHVAHFKLWSIKVKIDLHQLTVQLLYGCTTSYREHGLNISPPGLNISPPGPNTSPNGLNISPPGLNASANGLNISPPGLNISPNGLSISLHGLNTTVWPEHITALAHTHHRMA